jgi:transposase
MISDAMRAEIRRLHEVEKWPIGTIARQLGVHHQTVRRALGRAVLPTWTRKSKLDPYKPLIVETLDRYPRLCATRVFHMLRERGYPGSVNQVMRFVAHVRPKPRHAAYLRLRTLPGEQGQVDWASFGFMQVGRAKRRLSCFVLVLSWSRAMYARFFLDQQGDTFRRGHVEAFEALGGVPRELLYDNLKSAVLERIGDHIRFHPRVLELAGHYHFAPKPCAPYRGNEKGKVERTIQYLRHSFFAAREYRDLDDLNEQLERWIAEVAHRRPVPGDPDRRIVADALVEERQRLLRLPEHPLDCNEVLTRHSGKTPYIRFDLNDYSIPHDLVGQPLVLTASLERVWLSTPTGQRVAEHRRSWSRGEQIEDEAHLVALAREKRRARELSGRDRLRSRCEAADDFIAALAARDVSLGGHTRRLLDLLDRHGADELDAALRDCLARNAISAGSVAHVLDQRARRRGLAPTVPVVLPDDERVRELDVEPHDLADYDELGDREDNDDDDDEA